MILLTWAATIAGMSGSHRRSSRKGSRSTHIVARLADLLFHRRVGPAGFAVRLGLLFVVAVLSYYLGAGLGNAILKAPVPVALIIGALLVGWASGDPNTD